MKKVNKPPGRALPTALTALAVLISPLLLLAGCHKSADKVSTLLLEHQIDPQPPRPGPATITLKISDDAGQPLQRAIVRLEGNMTHAGMAPSFGNAEETGPGQYRAPLEFSMSGDWIVLVHITLPNGEKVEKQFDVKGVRSN